jgi:hypothetical protein
MNITARILLVSPDTNYDPRKKHCAATNSIVPFVWWVEDDGIHLDTFNGLNQSSLFRTYGEPVTLRKIVRSYSEVVSKSVSMFQFPDTLKIKEFMYALIATESGGNPLAERYEQSLNDYSIGLCQVLTKTAGNLAKQCPNLPTPPKPLIEDPNNQDLLKEWKDFFHNPFNSIVYATAMISLAANVTTDPILLYASYNAGGIYHSSNNKWGIGSYNDSLTNFAEWYGDACEVTHE